MDVHSGPLILSSPRLGREGIQQLVRLGPCATAASRKTRPCVGRPESDNGCSVTLQTLRMFPIVPEQARGAAVDKRADVWAFGCVFFEMVTATRAFEGANVAEVLASVLAREPDWSRIHSALTPVIAVYLKRCLQKDPKQRIHDIADVRLALDGAFDLPTPDRSPLSAPSPARATWLMTTLLLASVVGAGAAYLATQTSDSSMPRISCLEVTTSGASTLTLIDNQRHIAITPDGARLVYVGNRGTAVIRPPARLFGSDSSVHALPSRPVHLAR